MEKQGTVAFRFDTGLDVYLECGEDGEQLFMYSPLLDAPQEKKLRNELFSRMLQLNCLGLGTFNGTLSLHQERDVIYYHKSILLHDLTETALEDALNGMIQNSRDVLAVLQRVEPQLQQVPQIEMGSHIPLIRA